MARLADAVLDLRPDRLAVYSFARVPWIKPAQRKFKDDRPARRRRQACALRGPARAAARRRLRGDRHGPLRAAARRARAVGARHGTLHRNFMGYTDRRTTALLGLGVSAISETPTCYHQNEKVITVYERRVRPARSRRCADTAVGRRSPPRRPHSRADDHRPRAAGRRTMPQTRAMRLARARSPTALVEIDAHELRMAPGSKPFLRNVAAFFDTYLRASTHEGPPYSRGDMTGGPRHRCRPLRAGDGLAPGRARLRRHGLRRGRRPGRPDPHAAHRTRSRRDRRQRVRLDATRSRRWFERLELAPVFPATRASAGTSGATAAPRRWPLSIGESAALAARLGAATLSRTSAARDRETMAAWGDRVLGSAARQWLLGPAMQGIYATPAAALSARAILSGRRRGPRRMAAPRAGMGEFVTRLHSRLVERGVRFQFDTPVEQLDADCPTAICTGAPAASRLLAPHAPELLRASRPCEWRRSPA